MSLPIIGENKSVSLKTAKRMVDQGDAEISRSGALRPISDVEKRHSARQERGFRDDHLFPSGPYIGPRRKDKAWSLLSPAMMREVYRKSSAVKPAVDFLTRSLSTTPWRIVAEGHVPKRDFDFAVDLFTRPTQDSQTFRKVLSKAINDLAVLDMMIIEKIRAVGGSVVQFAPRDAATFSVEANDFGEIEGFKQQVTTVTGGFREEISFSPDDIVYEVFYATTESLYGAPPIEALVNEISALILASKSIASFFSKDEIPEGLLHMGDIGREAFARAKESFTDKSGYKGRRALRATYGRGEPRWVQFRRPFREMEVAQLMPRIERIIWRTFGITPLDMGMSADVNRSTSEAMKEIRTFTLFAPILDMLAESFTFNILHEIHENLYLEFVHFARTGQEGTQEGFDTDIPGEGEGDEIDEEQINTETTSEENGRFVRKSPLFGAARFGKGYRPVSVSSPDIYPRYSRSSKPKAAPDRWSTRKLFSTLASEGVVGAVRKAVEASGGSAEIILEEASDELNGSGMSKSEMRTFLSGVRDDIVNQFEYAAKSVEAAASQDVFRAAGKKLPLSVTASDLVEQYRRKIQEIVVEDVINSPLPADEEVTLTQVLDTDTICSQDSFEELASNVYRSAIRSSRG